MIPQRNLSLLSNRLARKGGRRIPEAVLERDYCLSWFLEGLSVTILRDLLVFKGGTAIKKCYIPDYRFSEDLDFTLLNDFSFQEIAAEKIVAILDPARNEPRDLYDLWYLASHDLIKPEELIDAVGQKMRFRGRDLADIHEIFIRKEARLKKLWVKRLAYQMVELPEFDEVHRRVLREFRQAGLF